MKKLLFIAPIVLLMLSASLFGAVGKRYTLVFPTGGKVYQNIASANGGDSVIVDDSTLASMTGAKNAFDLAQITGVATLKINTLLNVADTDIDSFSVYTRTSVDGVNWVTTDQGASATSTAGSSDTTTIALASAGGRYLQVIVQLAGDAGNSGVQTVGFKTFIWLLDGLGEIVGYKEAQALTSFQE